MKQPYYFVFPAHLCFDIVRRLLILKTAYLNLPSLYSNPNSRCKPAANHSKSLRLRQKLPAMPALHLDSYHVVAPKQQTNTGFQDLGARIWWNVRRTWEGWRWCKCFWISAHAAHVYVYIICIIYIHARCPKSRVLACVMYI